MTKQPLITIVTITYNLIKNNRANYIIQNLESVHNQTYDNIEHIIIDGASSDGTLELLKPYEEKGWIKIYSEPDNGIYDAFNKGVMKAKGKYINFLNSDDLFNNINAVKLSVEKLEKTKSVFSFATVDFINASGDFLCNFKPDIKKVYSRMPFCHQTMFTRVDIIKKEGLFDLNFKSASDYDLIIRLMLKKYKYCKINESIVSFRTEGESYTNVRTSFLERLAIFKKLYSHFANLSDEEYQNIILNNHIPLRLLLAMKVKDIGFYLKYYNFKSLKQMIVRFKFNFDEGIEYLTLFGKHLIKPKKQYHCKTLEEYIDSLEKKENLQINNCSSEKKYLFGMIKKAKQDNRRDITFLGFIKISYKKRIVGKFIKNAYLCSFADERFLFSQKILNHTAENFGIKKIYSYNPDSYKNTEFYTKNSHILDLKRGHGYWLWKPWIILETLKQMEDGEFLIYADSGSFIIGDVMPLIKHCKKNKGILVFENEHQYINLHWTKKAAFQIMEADCEEYWYHTQADAAFLVIQKNNFTVNFINEWLENGTNSMLITDEPSPAKNHESFIEHRHDQSILSILAQKHKLPFFRCPSQHGNYRKSFWLRRFREPKDARPYSNVLNNSPYGQIFHHHKLNPFGFSYDPNYQNRNKRHIIH